MTTKWIYLFGESTGADVKIGQTSRTLDQRLRQVNADQTTNARYVFLAAVKGTPTNEKALHRHFKQAVDKGSRTEYFVNEPRLFEYVNWLRAQYFVAVDPKAEADNDSLPVVDPTDWMPRDDRRHARPLEVEGVLLQPNDAVGRDLDGTFWYWLANPTASFQDYFTPKELVDAARVAMGDIDLDAASHFAANRVHQIPDYFNATRSAFENRWHGRVWLNPPYGHNDPWFEQIERGFRTDFDQLCMLSPVWAFTTQIAERVMKLSSAFVLLSPTPKFWGNSEGRTGTNNPHGIVYLGDRTDEFLDAFVDFGIPMSFGSVL